MINWANQNSGFLLVILTLVYVLATISILLVMAKSNRLTRKSLEQTENLEKSRLRPYLSVYLKIVKRGGTENSSGLPYGYLFLKNSGLSQALNISIEMKPQLYSEPHMGGEKIKKIPYFVEHKTHYLAPNGCISDDIGFLASYYERFDPPVFKGLIQYCDANDSKYKEDFTIDLEVMKNAVPYIND